MYHAVFAGAGSKPTIKEGIAQEVSVEHSYFSLPLIARRPVLLRNCNWKQISGSVLHSFLIKTALRRSLLPTDRVHYCLD